MRFLDVVFCFHYVAVFKRLSCNL